MFRGHVAFLARVLDTRESFTTVHFKPPVAGVEGAVVEMRNIENLFGTIRISSVATDADGMELGRSVIESSLNRLAFFHGMAIKPACVTGNHFSPITQQPDNHLVARVGCLAPQPCYVPFGGHAARATFSVSSTTIQSELESLEPPGEVNFGLFRSARLSVGPVEEFMHLYAILLMLFNDNQKKVDKFILSVEPGVQQTQDPHNRSAGNMETIYTRLRNEFAHKRQGVLVQETKSEMSRYIEPLLTVVRQAISQHS